MPASRSSQRTARALLLLPAAATRRQHVSAAAAARRNKQQQAISSSRCYDISVMQGLDVGLADSDAALEQLAAFCSPDGLRSATPYTGAQW